MSTLRTNDGAVLKAGRSDPAAVVSELRSLSMDPCRTVGGFMRAAAARVAAQAGKVVRCSCGPGPFVEDLLKHGFLFEEV